MTPVPKAPLLPETLVASWARSQDHGLRPDEPVDGTAVAHAELTERLEANNRLLTFSRPMIEGLYSQIASPHSTVLLADRGGMILSAVGHTDFLDRASLVALRPGVDWSEGSMGTNAIGTALQTADTVSVLGSEHYLERNRILACVATPILAPTGGMLGILDISSDARANVTHARALLRTTAELIEQRLIETADDGFLTLRFQAGVNSLSTPLHALAVFDETGAMLATSRLARALLNLPEGGVAGTFDSCFLTRWGDIVTHAARADEALFPLRAFDGRTFVARASLRRRRPRNTAPPHASQAESPARPSPPPTSSARSSPAAGNSRLGEMALGDARIAEIIDVLHECAIAPTPLLVEGEMGTGKAYVIRAFHADHCASPDAPIVGIDCRGLAPGAKGEEQVDIAWTQAANGILFLDEFDLLPVPLQARLFDANDGSRARIVGATRRPIAELEGAGHLDLRNFHANGGHILSMPPLRERSDFETLVRRFVSQAAPGRQIYIRPEALALLHRHAWPGNLRELRNQIALILALMGDEAEQLCPEDIPPELFEEDHLIGA
ncbi:sigma-54-dependent Fis family transcriptional regulator [Azoarcus sp. KH32C]|uniref:sigma-54-dependent Fis family transcriptional regulator n=1 Tax=Azoarcus sp. KH32C TaxID=748247 RepID=UPI0002386EA2|nr:GAF domain-containing protein [Azoarcus sp. KH32C]BAL23923.1 GAF modulated sigma-54 specific transcriptional regulator, Fis family [Azoarcus sp. KH32C]